MASTLAQHCPFKLGKRPDDLHHHPPRGGSGIDRFSQASEASAGLLDSLHQDQHVFQGARKSIQFVNCARSGTQTSLKSVGWALSGWVRVPVLRTRLSIFNANASAKRVPQVHEVGDDYAFAFLRRQFLRQQTLSDAALDARDLRLDQLAHTVAIFLLKGMNSFLLDVSGFVRMGASSRAANATIHF